MKDRTLPAFIYTLVPVLSAPVLFPGSHLLFFSPFLVLSYYKKNLLSALWLSLACGLIIDLFSAHSRFGLHALNYTLTTCVLHGRKQHFFGDSLSTIPLLTYLFGFISACIDAPLSYIFDQKSFMNWQQFRTEALGMPLYDAFYALIWFVFPSLFLPKQKARKAPVLLHKCKAG